MFFSKIFQILFIVGSTLLILHPGVSQLFGGVSRCHLKTEEEFYLYILSVLSAIRGSNSRPSSHNCFDCENYFHLSGAIQESCQFDSLEPIISELFFLAFSSPSLNLTRAPLDIL